MATYDEIKHAERVCSEVIEERRYQIGKFGGSDTDDRENMPNDFVAFIAGYSGRWFPGGFPPYSAEATREFRKSMVKVAALGVAGVQWADRWLARDEEHLPQPKS